MNQEAECSLAQGAPYDMEDETAPAPGPGPGPDFNPITAISFGIGGAAAVALLVGMFFLISRKSRRRKEVRSTEGDKHAIHLIMRAFLFIQ